MRTSSALRNYSFVFVLAILAASCGARSKKEAAPKQGAANRQQMVMNVDGYIVKPQPFAENIEVPGSIIANETTEIHPEVSGRIVRLNVAEGRYVSKGALLVKLYDADLQAQLKKLQAEECAKIFKR